MPEYAPFAQSTAIRRPVRSLRSARRCARGSCRSRRRHGRSRPRSRAGASSSSASISSSAASVSLRPSAVEELDAVVLGRVVRGGDDGAEVEREQRHGRESAARRRGSRSRRRRPPRRRPPRARAPSRACPGRRRHGHRPDQSADGAARAARPDPRVRSSPTTPRTPSVPKYRLATAEPTAPERGDGTAPVRARRGSAQALGELRSLAGLVQAGLLALDLARVAREEALALERDAQLGIGLDERAGDAVPHRACLAGRPAALDANAEVVAALGAGELERSHHRRAMGRAREVLLERAAVDPGRAVAGAEDHARDGGLPLAGALVLGLLSHSRSPAAAASATAPRADARGPRRSSA